MPIPLAIQGVTGRMGRLVFALAEADPAFAVAAPIVRRATPLPGGKSGVERLPDTFADGVVIDFSAPEATLAILPECVARKLSIVIATTGFTGADRKLIDEASESIPVILAPNTSLVVNLLFKLTELTATALAGHDFDVEIVERHHRKKKDSPSGTALQFAKLCQDAMGLTLQRHGREGVLGERPMHEIGIHAVRTGDNVGEHTIIFGAPGETLELVHKGTGRESYARGALLAAKFLHGKPPGRYTMGQVLGV